MLKFVFEYCDFDFGWMLPFW